MKDKGFQDLTFFVFSLLQKLTMVALPGNQVCYLSKLNDNLPRPEKMLDAFKKVLITSLL